MDEERLQVYKDLAKKLSKQESFRLKEAIVGATRFMYFRSDDLLNVLSEKKTDYQSFHNILCPDTPYAAKKILQHLCDEKILGQLMREPEDNDPQQQKRYPKKLTGSPIQNYDEKGFYIWRVQYDDNHKKTQIYLTLVLSAIAIVCLFPIWPRGVQVSIFYISLVLLYIIMGFTFVRLIMYLLVRISGYQFWILPNLYGDCGFLDSFRPVISFKKSKDDWFMIVMRLLGLIVFITSMFYLVKEPAVIPEIQQFGEKTFDDIFQWGTDFIDKKDIIQRGIPHLKDIDLQPEPEKVPQNDNFDDLAGNFNEDQTDRN